MNKEKLIEYNVVVTVHRSHWVLLKKKKQKKPLVEKIKVKSKKKNSIKQTTVFISKVQAS